MSQEEKIGTSQLRKILVDILNGYSTFLFGDDTVYIKHLTLHDAADIDSYKAKVENEAEDKGLEREEAKLDQLKKDELWTSKEDSRITELTGFIKNLMHSKRRLFIKKEIDRMNDQISSAEEELNKLIGKKEELLGLTCEVFAGKKINEYYVYNSIFKDGSLCEPFYTAEDFDELSNRRLQEMCGDYNDLMIRFKEKSLKKISLSPFFLNHFYLSEDNAYYFYGKPASQLTFFQSELYGYGRYFKGLMSRSKNKPPEEIKDDPDKLIEWYEQSHNAQEAIEKTGGSDKTGGSSLVGASKEELKNLGTSDQGEDFVSLAKEAAKKGGELSMKDLMKIHGV
jgi:hypothetical protein